MRNMGMLISIALIVIPTVVSAETWTAHTILEEEKSMSGRICPEEAISYTLDLTDNTFTATSQYGKMFSVTVPPDGVINTTYKRVTTGTKWVTLQMTGNVKSRELEIVWWRCYYKLASVEPAPPR
jgi:hypothetical protein